MGRVVSGRPEAYTKKGVFHFKMITILPF